MILKLDRDYEVKCTLGTIRDLEQAFGCSFTDLIGRLNRLTTEEQLKILFCGIRRANPDLTESRFFDLCDDRLGLGALADALEEMVYQLQYPGKSREEIEQIVQKKLAKAGQLKNSIGAESSAQAPARG